MDKFRNKTPMPIAVRRALAEEHEAYRAEQAAQPPIPEMPTEESLQNAKADLRSARMERAMEHVEVGDPRLLASAFALPVAGVGVGELLSMGIGQAMVLAAVPITAAVAKVTGEALDEKLLAAAASPDASEGDKRAAATATRAAITTQKEHIRDLKEQVGDPVMEALIVSGVERAQASWNQHHETYGKLMEQPNRPMGKLLQSDQAKEDLHERPQELQRLTELDDAGKQGLRELAKAGLSKEDVQALAGSKPVGGSVPGGTPVQASSDRGAPASPQKESPNR